MEAISIAGSLLISIKIPWHHISKEFCILPNISLFLTIIDEIFLVASIILVSARKSREKTIKNGSQ